MLYISFKCGMRQDANAVETPWRQYTSKIIVYKAFFFEISQFKTTSEALIWSKNLL